MDGLDKNWSVYVMGLYEFIDLEQLLLGQCSRLKLNHFI